MAGSRSCQRWGSTSHCHMPVFRVSGVPRAWPGQCPGPFHGHSSSAGIARAPTHRSPPASPVPSRVPVCPLPLLVMPEDEEWASAPRALWPPQAAPGSAGPSQSSALPAVTTQRPFPSPGRPPLQEMSFNNSTWDLFLLEIPQPCEARLGLLRDARAPQPGRFCCEQLPALWRWKALGDAQSHAGVLSPPPGPQNPDLHQPSEPHPCPRQALIHQLPKALMPPPR